jgi:hypothetical protein
MSVKGLWIASVVITSAVSLSCGDDKRAPFTKNQKADNGSLNAAFPYLETADQAPTPQASPADQESAHWYTSAEWWLFILGVPTLGVLCWQANETRRAATAAKSAATAALLNAQAVINAERAWLSANISPKSSLTFEEASEDEPGCANLQLDVVISNTGRTPALRVTVWSKIIVDSTPDFRKFPDDHFIPPSHGSHLWNDIAITPKAKSSMLSFASIDQEEIDAWIAANKFHMIFPHLLVEIGYNLAVSSDRRRTRYIFSVEKKIPGQAPEGCMAPSGTHDIVLRKSMELID